MKVKKQKSSVITNSTSSGFSISSDASFVIRSLINLYTKKEESILRELVCNAYDATADLENVEKRVVVYLGEQIIVEDFGTGMSHDFVMNGYTQIGNSTKRESDNQVGMFGLGRLSVLSYTDSYTLESSFEGVKRTYQIWYDKTIQIAFLKEEPCEVSGTKVTINAKVDHRWILAASKLTFCPNLIVVTKDLESNKEDIFKNKYDTVEFEGTTFIVNHQHKDNLLANFSFGIVNYDCGFNNFGLIPIVPLSVGFELPPDREDIIEDNYYVQYMSELRSKTIIFRDILLNDYLDLDSDLYEGERKETHKVIYQGISFEVESTLRSTHKDFKDSAAFKHKVFFKLDERNLIGYTSLQYLGNYPVVKGFRKWFEQNRYRGKDYRKFELPEAVSTIGYTDCYFRPEFPIESLREDEQYAPDVQEYISLFEREQQRLFEKVKDKMVNMEEEYKKFLEYKAITKPVYTEESVKLVVHSERSKYGYTSKNIENYLLKFKRVYVNFPESIYKELSKFGYIYEGKKPEIIEDLTKRPLVDYKKLCDLNSNSNLTNFQEMKEQINQHKHLYEACLIAKLNLEKIRSSALSVILMVDPKLHQIIVKLKGKNSFHLEDTNVDFLNSFIEMFENLGGYSEITEDIKYLNERYEALELIIHTHHVLQHSYGNYRNGFQDLGIKYYKNVLKLKKIPLPVEVVETIVETVVETPVEVQEVSETI